MTLRAKRLLIGAIYHLIIVVVAILGMGLGLATREAGLSAFFLLALILHFLTFRLNPLSRIIESRLIRETECPGCGYVIGLVSRWRCGCSFNPHYPRHAFSPCPNCGKVFSWVTCPSCDASICI